MNVICSHRVGCRLPFCRSHTYTCTCSHTCTCNSHVYTYMYTCSHKRVPSSSLIEHVYLHVHVHNVHVNSHSQVVFNWVLFHARKSVRHRENMRFSRSKLFGIYRELFRAIGSSLVALGLLEHRQVHSELVYTGIECTCVLYIVCLQSVGSVSTSLAPIQCG